jgi:PAS domain S-box-containing protein
MTQDQFNTEKIKDLENILDQSFMITIMNKNGVITHANKKFCEISKYEKNELVKQNHSILKSKFHNDQFYNDIWKIISSGKTWNGEIKNQAKDGIPYWIKTTILPFSNNAGTPEQYVTISIDLTSYKENEEQLKENMEKFQKLNEDNMKSQKKFRVLYDKTPTLLRTITTDGTITDCNESYLKTLGYTREEIIGKNLVDHTARRSFKEIEHNLEHWRKTTETLPSQIWCKRKDGSIFPALLTGTSLYDDDGKLVGRTLALTDLTEIHETKEMVEHHEARLKEKYEELNKTFQLLESKEKLYRNLYEYSPNLLRTSTTEGIIVDCNDAYAKTLGYIKKEVIGMTIFNHTAEKSIKDLMEDFKAWQETGNVSHIEIWCKRKDGSIFPTVLSGATLYDEKNNVTGRTVALTDISELHKTTNLLKELEEVEKLKEEFLSMVTHELKSPLTPIIGFAQALRKPQILGPLTPKQLDAVETILSSATRLKKLIGDLLDSQKLDLGKMKFENVEVDAKELISLVSTSFNYTLKDKNIEFVNNNQEALVIKSDRDRIEQVMSNLIYNAVDFVPKDKGKIEIDAKEYEGSSVVFSVKDNGIGIPHEKQEGLFKKFYQVDTSQSRKHGGSGLGLSICKGIVEGLGGKIWFTSEPGVGSIFYFSIPKKRIQ